MCVIALKIACNGKRETQAQNKKFSMLVVQSADVMIGIYVYVIYEAILSLQSDKGSHLSRGTNYYFLFFYIDLMAAEYEEC